MKVGFATVDFSRSIVRADGTHPLGGAGHYRVGIVADALARYGGHATVVGTLVGSGRTGALGILPDTHTDCTDPEERAAAVWWECDVIVMQRWMHYDVLADLPRARANGQVIVNDVDDHFDRLPPTNRAYEQTDPRTNPIENRDLYRQIIRLSSAVTVSTPALAEHYGALGVPTFLIRNAIDLERWNTHEHREPPVLGWVGATAFRARDLQQLQGVVRPLLGHGYAPRFHHSGHVLEFAAAHEQLRIDADQIDTWPMAPIDTYPKLLDAIDVGVVPLEPLPFNVAKSCIKGMEYAAAGIPFVASDTPEYRWLRDTHGIGRTARRARNWIGHLKALTDPDLRLNEARQNREAVAALDIANRWRLWESVYLSLL